MSKNKISNLLTKEFFIHKWKMLNNVSKTYLAAGFSAYKLPPGDFSRYEKQALADRLFLLKQFDKYGEIFKTIWLERVLICVVGLKTSHRMLTAHSDKLKPISVELKHIFPEGFIRNMRGETHRKYRNQFAPALKFEITKTNVNDLKNLIKIGLSEFSKIDTKNPTPASYSRTLNEIATGLLIHIFFGVEFGSATFQSLMSKYHQLGPDGFVWHVREQQQEVYREIFDEIKQLLADKGHSQNPVFQQSVIYKIQQKTALDETIIGNLIYMVEMGRFDMYSLFRWLTKFLIDNPQTAGFIAGESLNAENANRSLAKAFVLETLRLEQSEGVIREATDDFVFEDYLLPKGVAVRFCLWEPHKFENTFHDPFKFDHARFLDKQYNSIDQYAPFGLDHHRCPAGDMVILLSSLFVNILVSEFEVECITDGFATKGFYHWQPNKDFSVRLVKQPYSNEDRV